MALSHGGLEQAKRFPVLLTQTPDTSLHGHAVGGFSGERDKRPSACRLCLVASCPGGVASNVVTFLARADVPLSVAITAVSTLTAIVATPALAKLLVGKLVPVDASSLLLSTLQARLLAPSFGIMPFGVLLLQRCHTDLHRIASLYKADTGLTLSLSRA